MTARVVVALSWSLITGVVGGWLVLSPWALGERPANGDWVPVTRAEFFSGLGLVALAVIALLGVTFEVVAALSARSTRAPEPKPAVGDSPELESALVAVAQALSADLATRRSGSDGGSDGPRPEPAPRGADSASYAWRRDER